MFVAHCSRKSSSESTETQSHKPLIWSCFADGPSLCRWLACLHLRAREGESFRVRDLGFGVQPVKGYRSIEFRSLGFTASGSGFGTGYELLHPQAPSSPTSEQLPVHSNIWTWLPVTSYLSCACSPQQRLSFAVELGDVEAESLGVIARSFTATRSMFARHLNGSNLCCTLRLQDSFVI